MRRLARSYDPTGDAERSRRYRERHGVKRGTSGSPKKTLWDKMHFVAVDGEGFSDGPSFEHRCPDSAITYSGRQHYYALLKASDGSEVYAPKGRLKMAQCLKFLCSVKENNPHAVLVIFGGGYDVCQMLAFGLTRTDVAQVLRSADANTGRPFGVEIGDWFYEIEYRPRKSLTLRRWAANETRFELVKGKWRKTKHLTVTLWDVWGFFQASFAEVMRKWCPDDPDYLFIQRMKGERSAFDRENIDEIRVYTDAELRILVKVMNKLKYAIDKLGLKIARWDGAGAIASAAFRHHGVKDHMQDTPPHIFYAARHAYSGGHIEACKIGHHVGKVYHYDITSAYPDVFRTLPSLSSGRWIQGNKDVSPSAGFTLVRLRFVFQKGMSFYPLFFRTEEGSILYPRTGEGWYWMPEYDAALAYQKALGGTVQVIEWYHWQSDAPSPFGWVLDYYEMRRRSVEENKRAKTDDGVEKVLKLILNSLYGKTNQQVGWSWNKDRTIKKPSYFQLEWAGYVTSGCRAKLMLAALSSPDTIISMATDGVFSTRLLSVSSYRDKSDCQLGDWHYVTHDGMTIVMPGVYWLHDGSDTEHYSRGFDKRDMKDHQVILQRWAKGAEAMPINLERLIGLGTASTSETFWKMRGCFVVSPRTLDLSGDNSKRNGVSIYQTKPHTRLVSTWPKPYVGELTLSAPYKIAWMDATQSDDEVDDAMLEENDMLDASLV